MMEGFRHMRDVLTRRRTTFGVDPFHEHTRNLSVVDITCLGLATTLGTGIYVLMSSAAHNHAGPSVVLSILAAAVTACLGGLCYSEIVTRFPKGGSSYTYVYATTGEIFGFLVGWGMLLEFSVGTAVATKAFTQYLDVVLDGSLTRTLSGHHLENLNIKGLDKYLDIPSAVLILTISLVFVWSLKALCSLTNVLVVINLLVISGVVLVGIFNMDSENWIAGKGFFPGGLSGVVSAASLCYFAFVGYDTMAICTRDYPHRYSVFPTMVSTIFVVGLLGIFSTAVVTTLLIPYTLIEEAGSLLQAFDLRKVVGMRYFAAVGALSGLVSSVIVSFFSLTKILQSLAYDGLLFRFLCRTQCHSIIASSVLCSLLALFCDLESLTHALGMGTMISSISVAICVLYLRYSVSRVIRSPSALMELSEESTAGAKSPDRQIDTSSEKGSTVDGYFTKPNYGTLQTRSLSVDFVDESYVTCLSELSPHWTKQEPNHKSAATAAGLIAAAVLVMLLMGVTTLHVPRLLPNSKWWTEAVAFSLFLVIVVFSAAVCQQPKHKPHIRNRVPCVPFLPLFAILLDIHLITGLPYTSWVVYIIWTLIGMLLYVSYGIWNSSERKHHDAQHVNLLSAPDDSEPEITHQSTH